MYNIDTDQVLLIKKNKYIQMKSLIKNKKEGCINLIIFENLIPKKSTTKLGTHSYTYLWLNLKMFCIYSRSVKIQLYSLVSGVSWSFPCPKATLVLSASEDAILNPGPYDFCF